MSRLPHRRAGQIPVIPPRRRPLTTMTYRLLALDIDGTLLDRQSDTPLTERTKRAIASVFETGAGVTLATGRTSNSAIPFSRDLGLTLPIISYQGSLTSNPVTNEIVRETPSTLCTSPSRLIRLLEDRGLNPYVYVRDHFYVREMTDAVRQSEEFLKIKAEPVSDLVHGIQESPTKIVVVGDAELIGGVTAMVDSNFNGAIAAMHTYDYLCEIGHPDGSKSAWPSANLASSLGVKREEVVAVGDSPNDIDMIEWAGLGVAMGNAPEKVKSTADIVAKPVSEQGLALLIEDLLSKGRFAPLPAPQPTTL